MSSGTWPYILNLGNSIIGVAVLAMPFCFKQCGIILGIVLLLFCTWLTLVSCQLLMKAAVVSRKRSYEFLAYYTFGAPGKFVIEIGMIGLQLGTLIAQIVVIGDLGPGIMSKVFGFENTHNLRTFLIVFLCMCVGLPLGLLKDLRSVSRASTLCICFYTVFVFYVLALSGPNLWSGKWYSGVHFWRPAGLFQTLPIFSFSFGCQTQLFLLYDSLPEPTLKSINGVISSAVNLCAVAYLLVGFFGYIAFYESEVGGDIITLFPSTFAADMMKLFFVVSIAVTFPLIIFPCRASLYTLLFPQKQKAYEDLQEENHIPELHFKFITVAIVAGSMVIGILVPNVEFILGMNGATMGTLICYIFPALFFVRVMANKAEGKHIAQLVMILGITILLVSTFATLYTQDKGHTHPVVPKEVEEPVKQDNFVLNKPVEMPIVDSDKKNEKRIEPPVPDAPVDTIEKKEGNVEKKVEELPKKNGLDNAKVPDKDDTVKSKKESEPDTDKKVIDTKEGVGAKDTGKEGEKKAEAGDKEVKEEVVAKEEHLKEREKKIEENEQKQQVLLEKLVEQQEEQKQLINEQKQLLQELKEHKEKEHKDDEVEDDAKQPGQNVQQVLQQPAQAGQGVQGVQQAAGQGIQQPAGQAAQQPVQGIQQPVGQAAQQPVQVGVQQPVQGAIQQPVQGGVQQPVQGGIQQPVQGVQQQAGQGVQQQAGQGAQQPIQGIQQGVQQPVQGVQQQAAVGVQQQAVQGIQQQQPVQGLQQQPLQGVQQQVQGGQLPVQGGLQQQPLQGMQQPVQQQQVLNQPIQGQQGIQQPLQGQQLLQQPHKANSQQVIGQNAVQGQQQQVGNIRQQAAPAQQQVGQNQQQFAQQPLQQNLNQHGNKLPVQNLQQGLNQQPVMQQQANLQAGKQFVQQQAGGVGQGQGQGQQAIGQQGAGAPAQNLNVAAKNIAAVKQGVGMDAGNNLIQNRQKRELSEAEVDDVLKEVEGINGREGGINKNIADRIVAINKVSRRR